MQRKFLSNLILVLVLNVLIKPFYILGVDAEFLKRLESTNPGEYGEYFSIVGLTFIFNIFLDLGLSNFNTKEVAQQKDCQLKYFSSIMSVKFMLIFGYFLLLFVSGFALDYSDHQFKLLSILGLNQVLVAFILFFRSNLTGMLRFKEDSFIGVLDRFLLVIMCSVVLWGGLFKTEISILWFVWMQTISYGLTLCIVVLLVARRGVLPRLNFDFQEIGSLVRKSLPYAVLVLLMTIYYRTDSVMLEQMLPQGKREAALYAQGFRFLEAFTMIGYLFAGLLLPIFSRMIKKQENVSEITQLSFKLIFSISAVLALGVFIYSKEIIQSRYQIDGLELERSALSLQMLMICFLGMVSTYIFGTLLTANGSLKWLNIIAGSGVVLNLVLNFIWIEEEGAYGAAKASMITQLITAILQLVLAIYILKVKVKWVELIRVVLFITLLLVFGIFVETNDWLFGLIVVFFGGGAIAMLTGMFSPREAIRILKSKE